MALLKAEEMVAANHFQAKFIKKEATALQELNSEFQKRVSTRLRGLEMAVEFFKLARELFAQLDSSVVHNDEFQSLQKMGADLLAHIDLTRPQAEKQAAPSSKTSQRSLMTADSVKDILESLKSRTDHTAPSYEPTTDRVEEVRRWSIVQLEGVLDEINDSVRKTLHGEASPAPPPASETIKNKSKREAKEKPHPHLERQVAPMKFSLWDREGSVRQLRRKFEKIASDDKPRPKSEEQKLLDKLFTKGKAKDPIIAQAKLKETSTPQPVSKITTKPLATRDKTKSHRTLKSTPSVEQLHVERKVTKLKGMFESTIHESDDRLKSSEQSSGGEVEAHPTVNGGDVPVVEVLEVVPAMELPPLTEEVEDEAPQTEIPVENKAPQTEPVPPSLSETENPVIHSEVSVTSQSSAVGEEDSTAEPAGDAPNTDETDFSLRKKKKDKKESIPEKKRLKSLR